jgi:hypothetical protein
LAHAPKRGAREGEVTILAEKIAQHQIWPHFFLFFFAILIVGLALVSLMVLQPNLDPIQFAGQRSFIGALFLAFCVSGVVAAFYPGKCRGMFQYAPNPIAKANTLLNRLQIEGHHPNCQNFSKNRITVGGRVFCAACSGLLVGAMFALIGAIVYFFGGLNVAGGGIWLVLLGQMGIVLGLAQIKASGFIKMGLNAVFVISSLVVLAAVDSIANSMFVDLYVLGLILFLLWFRILLSEWNNKQTCRKCKRCFH